MHRTVHGFTHYSSLTLVISHTKHLWRPPSQEATVAFSIVSSNVTHMCIAASPPRVSAAACRLAATAAPALVPQRPDRPRPKRPCHRLQNYHIGSEYHRFSLPNGSFGNAAGKEMTTHVAEVFQPQTPSWRHIRQPQHMIDLQYTQVVRQVAVASATSRLSQEISGDFREK